MPDCFHPLPLDIDDRLPFVIAVVGNTRASKTTLLAALIKLGETAAGQEKLGLLEFSVDEASRALLKDALASYAEGTDTDATNEQEYRAPIEVCVTFVERPDEPVLLLLHDLGGEIYQDPFRRSQEAPHIRWANAAIFVVNPEETPGLGTKTSDAAQEGVLNGLLRGLKRDDHDPPLAIALGKADLVHDARLINLGRLGPGVVEQALIELGAEGIVSEAARWPQTSFHAVAPQRPDFPEFGVADLFRTVFDRMASPDS